MYPPHVKHFARLMGMPDDDHALRFASRLLQLRAQSPYIADFFCRAAVDSIGGSSSTVYDRPAALPMPRAA